MKKLRLDVINDDKIVRSYFVTYDETEGDKMKLTVDGEVVIDTSFSKPKENE